MEGLFAERLRRFPLWQPLTARDFRLLFFGQSVSLFGDQFYLVALPWLTLQLTGSGLALGTVLMVEGGSRAIFQLVGGALSDRYSLRSIILISNLVRGGVALLVTAIVLSGVVRLWHLIGLALLFGIVDAFFYPAFLAVIPRVVGKEQLTAGNALMRGINRLMGMIGPAAAGLVIFSISIAAAFAIDAATFLFAAVTVWFMSERKRSESSEAEVDRELEPVTIKGLLVSIREGLKYAWTDPLIRTLLLFVAAVEFSFVGPSSVGLAVLAKNRFGGGEATSLGGAAFATILSAFGAGMLAGMIIAGSIRTPKRRGPLIITISFLLGIALASMGGATSLIQASIVFALIGLGGGFSNIVVLAWMQSRTDARVLGRVMSLVMFSALLLEPLSLALAGLLSDASITLVFAGAGAIMLLTSAISLASRTMRNAE